MATISPATHCTLNIKHKGNALRRPPKQKDLKTPGHPLPGVCVWKAIFAARQWDCRRTPATPPPAEIIPCFLITLESLGGWDFLCRVGRRGVFPGNKKGEQPKEMIVPPKWRATPSRLLPIQELMDYWLRLLLISASTTAICSSFCCFMLLIVSPFNRDTFFSSWPTAGCRRIR